MNYKNWKQYKLDEVYEFSSGLSKKRDQFGFGFEFLSFKDVFHNYFLPEKLTELVNSSDREREKASIKRGDVFLTRTSEKQDELGFSSVALKDYPNATFNGFTKRLRPKHKDIILPEFATFYFRSPVFRNQVTSMSSMTTRASLNNSMLSVLTISVPPLEEQEKIANLLMLLTKKMQVNNIVISKLEELAQTLFKRWFIDYEFPNKDGEPYKTSGGEMVECELRIIPKGWRVGTAGDLFEFAPKTSLKKGEEAIFVEMKNLESSAMIKEWTQRNFTGSGSKFINGDTLLARITPCLENGKIGFIDFLPENNIGWGSTEFIPIRSKKPISPVFSYFFTSQSSFKNYAISNMNGSSGRQRVSANTLAQYSTIIPPFNIIKRYTDIVEPLMKKMKESRDENKLLTSLRDTLLPKLLSGEIEIPIESEEEVHVQV